jgi:hypothetical protein
METAEIKINKGMSKGMEIIPNNMFPSFALKAISVEKLIKQAMIKVENTARDKIIE